MVTCFTSGSLGSLHLLCVVVDTPLYLVADISIVCTVCNSYTMAISGVWNIHARDPRASVCIFHTPEIAIV